MHHLLPFDAWPGLALWLCRLHEAPSAAQQTCLHVDEAERARRFVHEVHRRRYVAAHVALRERLAPQIGTVPASLRFRADAHGKPGLAGGDAWQFNMSHSDDWMLLGLQRDAPLGVDIEVQRPLSDARALAARHYTEAERAAVEVAPEGPARDAAFLRVWTRKEACLKAVGLGLRLAPSSFEAGAQPGLAIAHLATPDGTKAVEVVSVNTGSGTLAAAARVRV